MHAADAFATATVVGAIEGVCRDMLKSADVVPNLLLLFPPAPAATAAMYFSPTAWNMCGAMCLRQAGMPTTGLLVLMTGVQDAEMLPRKPNDPSRQALTPDRDGLLGR